ncbi:hypothetical protein [Streptomyces sp. NPDC005969]|uniref:hypothetical protein n=1 Tax=Streptomyces sp. NPDC005969 TaxID=3156722 RepID=UPI0033C41D0D
MTDAAAGETPQERTASARPDDRIPSVLRFSTELVAWVTTPWVLAGYSWLLAALSLVVLIGLPAVLSTPGDKNSVIVAVPGWATILMVLAELGAAVVSSWLLWPVWAAVPVTLLAAAAVVTEQPRWRWLVLLKQGLSRHV